MPLLMRHADRPNSGQHAWGMTYFDKSVKLYPFNENRQFSNFARDKQMRSCAAISTLAAHAVGADIQVSVG